jgi:Bacterial SH3 domain
LIDSSSLPLNRAETEILEQEGVMNLAKIAASAAVFTALSIVSATAKPTATTAETNLRKEPGTKSEVVTLIPKGTSVELGQCSNGWCKASLNGQDGYVIARNVGMAPSRRPPPRGAQVYDEEVEDDGAPPPRPYGPPVYYGYYGYGPYYGYGWGWAHYGWGRRW